jgi:N-acetylglucosamine kinase-like BadF-type ATPase
MAMVWLALDVGGTRSTAMVVREDGTVAGRADGGPGNYQAIGHEAARRTFAEVVSAALREAELAPSAVRWAGYGIAGADRPKDFAAIEALLPADIAHHALVNDTLLVLHAGTPDGVGVALVSGTGTNAVGRNARGLVARVGGLAPELGDFGSAADLGREALRLAMRGHDGRGAPTLLYERLCAAMGLGELEDIIDLWIAGDGRASRYGALAPLVFEAAADGDAVARGLLERAGREAGLCARLLIERLFEPGEPVSVVLGGSVLQRGVEPTLVQTIARELAPVGPHVEVLRLVVEPVLGGVLLAREAAGESGQADFRRRLAAALGSPLSERA